MGDIRKYYTTCFKDKSDNIIGKLNIGENVCIDFDCRDIFVNGEPQEISETAIKILECVLIHSPGVATYQELLKVYGMYGKDINAHSSDDRQVLRNLFSILRKIGHVNVQNKAGRGYFYKLDKKIAKFSVDGNSAYDMGELFKSRFGVYPEGERGDSSVSSAEGESSLVVTALAESGNSADFTAESSLGRGLEFSSRFFGSGALKLMTASKEEVLEAFVSLGDVYGLNSAFSDNEDEAKAWEGNFFGELYCSVVKACKSDVCGDVLKIKGPLGSYKNRVMQYLYLALEKNNPKILPFYIDIAYYEKKAESDRKITEADLIKMFREDIALVSSAIENAGDRVPLLMLDGVRDFSVGNESLYYAIKESLDGFFCKKVICLDSDFTVNKQHKFKIHPLVSGNFCLYLRIRSLNLYDRRKSIEFIRNCISIFKVNVPAYISAENIYENLVRLNFISLDAYWLVYLLNRVLKDIVNPGNNIGDIYETLALIVLGSVDKVESAAEIAYAFEFGQVDIGHGNPYYDIRWKLIRKHRSMLDFLISRYYILRLCDLSCSGDLSLNLKKLDFFNMVLQKRITRFIVSMLRGNDSAEHRIMVIARKHYHDLSLFGKSELTFWMARLNNHVRRTECVALLEKFFEEDSRNYKSISPEDEKEKRDAAFLLRGSSVSLIYENNKKAFKDYITSLVTDKVANSVNRGFHLEYYGDKEYVANQSLLDYEDEVDKGENTFNVLCGDLDRKLKKKSHNDPVMVLELMTLCNLIQARVEVKDRKKVFDFSPYAGKCMKYLDFVLRQNILSELTEVRKYFRWFRSMLAEAENENEGSFDIKYNRADVFNTFSKAKHRLRTGWVNRDIPDGENIVEHMYNCWLMGMIYLPETYPAEGYCKNTILSMLLIHDMGETVTGDIDRGRKNTNREEFERKESEAMDKLLFAGTYHEAVNLSPCMDIWNSFESRTGINYQVAKDIDEVQAVYQYCVYYKKHRGLMSPADARCWLANIDILNTELVRGIAEILILKNPEFTEILSEINGN